MLFAGNLTLPSYLDFASQPAFETLEPLAMVGLPGATRNSDTVSRRTFLRAGGGLLGLTQAMITEAMIPQGARAKGNFRSSPKAESVIFVFLFGGPSQLETFDLKPDAPDKIRGPFLPIGSRTPGLRICEHLPKLANISDKYSILKTMTHTYNDHSGAGHYLQTGRRWHVPIGGGFAPTPNDWPSMGSVVDCMGQKGKLGNSRGIPNYFVIPNSLGRLQEAGQYRRPGEHPGWLGKAYSPLTTSVDKKSPEDNPYWRNCSDAELTFQIEGLVSPAEVPESRIVSRESLLGQFDSLKGQLEKGFPASFSTSQQKALSLLTSDRARDALDFVREPEKIRDFYGRNLFGQSCLMARRLVEAGTRFVTIHYDCCDGYSWDSHRNSKDVKNHLLPTFDQGMAALLVDLDQRGLLDKTLVIALGEMGRTPKANGDWGRDHWSFLFPALFSGAGIRPGEVFGQTDGHASHPLTLATTPEDLAATVYQAIGINPDLRMVDSLNRELALIEKGRPIEELWG